MTDLTQLLPNFPIDDESYTILERLEAKGVTTLDLLTLTPTDVGARTGVRRDVIEPFIATVSKALREDMGVGRTDPSPADPEDGPTAQPNNIEPLRVLNGVEALNRPKFITTGDPALDKVLGGGIPTGYIIEIVGESGAGKTNFLLPLLLTVQLPPSHGGISRSALYLSTESPLSTKRLFELHAALQSRYPDIPLSTDCIHTIHVTDLDSQDAALRYRVPLAIQTHNIGLLILDSVAANFRGTDSLGLPTSSFASRNNDPASLARRGKELVRLGQTLRSHAMRYNIAIVVANQVSDKFAPPVETPVSSSAERPPEQGESDVLALDFQARWFTGWEGVRGKVPALGMVWTNCINARIAIYKEVGELKGVDGLYTDFWRRRLRVVFAPWVGGGREVEFVIEKGGLRGLEEGEGIRDRGKGKGKEKEEEGGEVL